MPARFRRRAAFAFAAFVTLVVFGIAGVVSMFAGGGRGPHGPQRGIFALVIVVAVVVLTVRLFRRWATPVGDLMEATERLAAGDLTARASTHRGRPEMRRMAETFNDMARRLESDDERRRRFLADVTHELRTPLTILRGELEAMIDGVRPAAPDRIASLLDETRRMERLVDDLRTLSLADAAALPLHRQPTNPAALVAEAVSAFATEAATAGIDLVAAPSPSLPPVDVDPMRVHQVLANLIGNAIRHTPPGGTVTVAATADGPAARFSVSDTGPGIPPEDRSTIFERFTRSADTGGSGLGLTIARDLVHAHGGTIGVDPADPAPGACFWFTVG